MPLERLDGPVWGDYCRHPEHKPPVMISLPPGTYRHTCPECGNQVVFTIRPGPNLSEPRPGPYGWKPTCQA